MSGSRERPGRDWGWGGGAQKAGAEGRSKGQTARRRRLPLRMPKMNFQSLCKRKRWLGIKGPRGST